MITATIVALGATGCGGTSGAQAINIGPGQSIAQAVAGAAPGSTVVVNAGTYHESVNVTVPGITLKGLAGAVIDGANNLQEGVNVTASNVTITGLTIQNFTDNAIFAVGVSGLNVTGNVLTNNSKQNGQYGVFPSLCSNGSITNNVCSGWNDTGIYVGQSHDMFVGNNECFGNVSGYEIENSARVTMTANSSHDNSAGMLCFDFPLVPAVVAENLTVFDGSGNVMSNNVIKNNNRANSAAAVDIVSAVPPGTGMFVISCTGTQVTGNDVEGNATLGIAVFDLGTVAPVANIPNVDFTATGNFTPKTYDPEPQQTHVSGNTSKNNGPSTDNGGAGDAARFNYAQTVLGIADPNLAGLVSFFLVDLSWDGFGQQNCWATTNSFVTGSNANLAADPSGASAVRGTKVLPVCP